MPSDTIAQLATTPVTPAADDDWIVRIRDLSKMYPLYTRPADRLLESLHLVHSRHEEFWALKGLNLEIRRGEIVAVIGRNGSGKSTLLQILAGVLRPTLGQIELRGRVAALLELGSGFNPEFTGRENIHLNGMILGLSRAQIDRKMDAIIAFADLAQFIDQPVKRYSSGMYVRLAFSIATHVDAELLLIDEALAVGDSAFQFKCLHRLEELLATGVTILLVTHDIQLVRSYCNRAVYLKQGHIEFDGDCEPAAERYITEARDAEARQRNQRIAEKGASGTSLRFGSDRGSIRGVRIGCGHQERTDFNGGERIWVRIDAQVTPAVKTATLLFHVRDLRGQTIYGLSSQFVKCPVIPGPDGAVHGEFSFDCNLQRGVYSIIVRLAEAMSPTTDGLIEKLVNAAIFEVVRSDPQIMGVCDLNGSFKAY
jgi:lipopolysaccharide transport system ATP-binding protein